MQVALVKSTLPAHQQVGILTIAQQSLGQRHLAAVNVPADTPIMGMDRADTSQSFVQSILNNETYLDVDQATHEIRQAALQFKAEYPDLAALVLECTNMTPYAALLQRELNLPVYSIYSLICWFQSGLKPKAFAFSL